MHSNGAHNLLSTMRVGVIRGGAEVEIWKRSYQVSSEYHKDSKGNKVVRAGEQVTRTAEPVATSTAA